MILDRAKKFVFVHIPKTGGTSITRTLEKQVVDGIVTPDITSKHWSASRIMREFPEVTSKWVIVTAVRNPWDLIYSDYQFCVNYSKKLDKLNRDRLGGWMLKLERTAGYSGIGEFADAEYLERPTFWHHYCTDHLGTELTNKVLRFENLNAEYRMLCDELGYRVEDLPRINATDGRVDYHDVYDPSLVEKIRTHYRLIIDRFGYSY